LPGSGRRDRIVPSVFGAQVFERTKLFDERYEPRPQPKPRYNAWRGLLEIDVRYWDHKVKTQVRSAREFIAFANAAEFVGAAILGEPSPNPLELIDVSGGYSLRYVHGPSSAFPRWFSL
jgi:hypothetical protein